jgi:membrane-associated protease RseP (regulator of RpoE activity)
MQKLFILLGICIFSFIPKSFTQDSEGGTNRRNAKAFMGVTLGANWGDGVSIKAVSEDYGADRAGLKKGDIITAINKDKVGNDADFTRLLRKYKPSEEVEVSYLRGKEKNLVKVKLAESPNSWSDWTGEQNINLGDWDGLKEDLEDLKEDLKDDLNDLKDDLKMEDKARIGIYPETDWSARAVRITGLTKKSPAKDAGLQKDDLILKLDNENINTEEELRYFLKKHKPNDEVSVTYQRAGKENVVKVKLGAEKTLDWNKNIYYNDAQGWGTSYSRNSEKTNETRTWSSYTFADGTQIDLNDFTISPKDDKVKITFESKLAQPFSIVIYDNNGKEVVREERSTLDGKFEKEFDLKAANSDTYFAKLWIAGKEAFSQKFNTK